MRALWLVVLLSLPALGRPKWADKPDSQDERGHTFICEGQGATEEDAFAAAQGICNDKICKLCGVEIESVVETRETLTGVDLSRKVVERCRRVRKSETKVKSKATDCEDGSCSVWVEIFYPVEDQKAECTTYTKEDFTDPKACEADVQGYRLVEGRTAESFRKRRDFLDQALQHCARIDVRPTPAILALDEKLRAGLDSFEWTQPMDREVRDEYSKPVWAFYAASDPSLRSQVAESRLLIERLRLVRDLVANKALVFAVIEAAQARDLDSPAGIDRLVKAMLDAPPGRQYGARNVHFGAVGGIWRFKTDTSPLSDVIRKLYPDGKAEREDTFTAAKLFAQDGKTSPEEWEWIVKAHQRAYCVECLRTLLAAPDHGSRETQLARAVQALPLACNRGNERDVNLFWELVGYSNPLVALELEPRVPERLKAAYSWKSLREGVERSSNSSWSGVDAATRAQFMKRAAQALADEKPQSERDFCTSLANDLQLLQKAGAPLEVTDPRTCSCLTGPLRNETHLVNRDDLLQIAKKRGLACAKGLPE